MNDSADMAPAPAPGINGHTATLAIDRAVGELRRGRAIHIADGGRAAGPAVDGTASEAARHAAAAHDAGKPAARALVVAAVEAAQAPLLRRLEATGRELLLLLTPERARAAELAGRATGPVAIAVPAGCQPEELRALACVSPIGPAERGFLRIREHPGFVEIAAAGFELAKAGRLLPALVGIEADRLPDPSVLTIDVTDVQCHARFARHSLKRMSQSRVPLGDALDCELALFRDEHGLGEHVAVIIGNPEPSDVLPVRLHSACLTGDLLGSLRCDCGEQLRSAVARIAALGGGVLLYLDQEGRGIGLANKLRAYALQDNGFDTIDADRHLGFHSDERNYDVAVALLQELGVRRIRLLTNNPQKIAALRAHGIDVVGRLPLIGQTNSHNARYLKAKRERAGHLAEEPGA